MRSVWTDYEPPVNVINTDTFDKETIKPTEKTSNNGLGTVGYIAAITVVVVVGSTVICLIACRKKK